MDNNTSKEIRDFRESEYSRLISFLKTTEPEALNETQEEDDHKDVKYQKSGQSFFIHIWFDDEPDYVQCTFTFSGKDRMRRVKTVSLESIDDLISEIQKYI